ncbi:MULTISPECIES: MerR family transcriptional regulator [unclassified Cytobacillus]|uniref:MerR family transcriptional regulator n=1 Tax=unclassified Cytobacillus TaxID=2675268 RepID=UPI001358CD17|nr:MerR family transcriptional regulator [Cytobacillus sp. AMY 15.2]KAF0819972.1 Regulatory protein MerR [Bacillus sp. ZZV12-4809]MCM3093176.1 MerR family transcriptional regulator [Cytobacillus sp. AMY 15.2]
MAEKAKVTKRTIDYYTSLGLLEAERSPSNYRYYDCSSIERIAFIEKCKADGLSLEEIKKKVISQFSEEVDVLELRLKIQDLEEDVTKALSQLKKSDPEKYEYVKKNISNESLSLIQSLLLLLN